MASIASADNTLMPALLTNATYALEGNSSSVLPFGFTAGKPALWNNVTLPLFATSLNTSTPDDACDPLPETENTPDLSRYIVLIRRGTCAFTQKIQNVAALGARYIIFYNNLPAGTSSVTSTGISQIQAVAMITADQGATWIKALSAGENVTVSMPDPETAQRYLTSAPNNITGGYLSTYTSWGPTFEAEFKPQIASPGGNIISTYPTLNGSYAVLSGTSMACPMVAAIYALLMNVRGTKDPTTLGNLLASTAIPKTFNNGTVPSLFLAPAAQQGAGMVQAYDAAYATTLVTVSSMSFNDTDNIVRTQEFTISNTANETITYTLQNDVAATAYTFDNGSIFPASFTNALTPEAAVLTYSIDNPFTIPAGQQRIISVTCTPPMGLDSRRLPVYSGYISINGSDGTSLSIPYMGIVGSLKSTTVMAQNSTFMTSTLSLDNTTSIQAGRTFLLPPQGRSNDTQFRPDITDYPQLIVSMAFGSPMVRVEVFPISVPQSTEITESLGMRTVGDVFQTPLTYQPRNAPDAPVSINWDGRLATGDYAPPGTYRMAVRALKVFGDRANISDYEVVETVDFGIQYEELDVC